MSRQPLPALPEEELRRLEAVIGKVCTGIRFCHMRDSDVEFESAQPSGLHEVTFAVLIDLADAPSLCITWTQDALGNPNRLSLVDSGSVLENECMAVQDVSARQPWASAIGQPCTGIHPYTYRSNDARFPSSSTWHDVLWGLEFHFAEFNFLVAAAWHGHALSHPLANDELVLAYTPASIGQMVALRDDYEEEWSEG